MTADGGFFSLGEIQRLKDLHALDLLYTPAEERFDRITRLAARVLQSPMATISLVAEDTEWVKSSFGIAALNVVPRPLSFGNLAIRKRSPLVVNNAAEDEQCAGNVLVTEKPFIRFYAGQPIHGGSGSAVGALCVMDTMPRQLSHGELDTLRDLAVITERELARRVRNSFEDTLIQTQDAPARRLVLDEKTRLWNRTAIMELAHLECAAASLGSPLSMLLVNADNLGWVNENFGEAIGNEVLHDLASEIRHSLRETDVCGRYGGDTFMALLRAGLLDARQAAERICRAVERREIPGLPAPITVSVGVASVKSKSPTPATMIFAANKVLNLAKEAGRNQVGCVLL